MWSGTLAAASRLGSATCWCIHGYDEGQATRLPLNWKKRHLFSISLFVAISRLRVNDTGKLGLLLRGPAGSAVFGPQRPLLRQPTPAGPQGRSQGRSQGHGARPPDHRLDCRPASLLAPTVYEPMTGRIPSRCHRLHIQPRGLRILSSLMSTCD